MVNGLIGKKLGMTQIYDENGKVQPVTVVEAGPCIVTQVKSPEKDKYAAVQLGLVEAKKPKKLSKPQLGHLKKNNISPLRHLREFKTADSQDVKIGDQVLVTIFKEKDKVDVVGKSKGKGFQGVIKRHGFGGGRMTHGSNFHRAPGSIGQCATPSRVFPGKKMPGQMGSRRVTVKNLEIVQVIEEQNLVLVKGAIPGAVGCLVTLHKR